MGVEISRNLLEQVLAHAAREPGREVCGLLLAAPQPFAPSVSKVVGVVAAANVSPNPADSFEIDPRALFDALRAERAGGACLVGHYHSHPNGRATPSKSDAAMATSPGRFWLVVASGAATLWREVPGGAVHGAFAPVELLMDGADEGCA